MAKNNYHYMGFIPFTRIFLKKRPHWHLWVKGKAGFSGGERSWFTSGRWFGRTIAELYENGPTSIEIIVGANCSKLQLERIKAACACYSYYRAGVNFTIRTPARIPMCLEG